MAKVHKQQLLVNELHDILEEYDYDENLMLAKKLAWYSHTDMANNTRDGYKLADFVWKEIITPKVGKNGATVNEMTKYIYDWLTDES